MDQETMKKIKEKVKGKKLLVLGAGPNEVPLVKRARLLGCHVTVTDNNTDRSLSPCKRLSDEYWDISWSDIPSLADACRESGIDGVTAGWSEIRTDSLIKLCDALKLPCYCSMAQLRAIRDKLEFKAACRRNGVPVVEEYTSIDDVEEYPVIVKPADRAGSIGIAIASNRMQLERAYREALSASLEGRVVIERYLENESKLDAYYSIIDGEIRLLSTNDVVFAKENGRERVVQTAWLLPSRHQKSYDEAVDPSVRKLISDLRLKNGYLFVSSFVDSRGRFRVFEAGFRLCGGHLYNFFEAKGMPNTLDLFILHALTGDVSLLRGMEDTRPDLKCVDINFYSNPGMIDRISGFEEAESLPGCSAVVKHARVGQECAEGSAILSKIGMIGFCDVSPSVLSSCVADAYKFISVLGKNGEDMVYDRIDPSMIAHWWD